MEDCSVMNEFKIDGFVTIEAVKPNGERRIVSESKNHVFVNSMMCSEIFDKFGNNVSYTIPLVLLSKYDVNGLEIEGAEDFFDAITSGSTPLNTPLLPGRRLGFARKEYGGTGAYIGAYNAAKSYNIRNIADGNGGWEVKVVFDFSDSQAQGGSIGGDNKNTINWIGFSEQFPSDRDTQGSSHLRRAMNTIPGSPFHFTANGYLFKTSTDGNLYKKFFSSSGNMIANTLVSGSKTIIPGYDVLTNEYYAWNTTDNLLYKLNSDFTLATTTTLTGGLTTTKPVADTSFIKSGDKLLFNNTASFSSSYKIGVISTGNVSTISVPDFGKHHTDGTANFGITNVFSPKFSILDGCAMGQTAGLLNYQLPAGIMFDNNLNCIGINIASIGLWERSVLCRIPAKPFYFNVNNENGVVRNGGYSFTGYKVDSFVRGIDEGLTVSYKLKCNY